MQNGAHDPVSVTLGVSMTEDALRRDFSVNALYYDLLSGEVIDPTGKGLQDLAASPRSPAPFQMSVPSAMMELGIGRNSSF